MTNRVYVRDLQILLNLRDELSKFSYGAKKVLIEVAHGVAAAKEFLQRRASYWNRELHIREVALRVCEFDGDRNCNAEVAAVREAQEALEKVRRLSSRLERAVAEYDSPANRLRQILDGKINKAKSDLSRSFQKYQDYLSYMTSKEGTHGYPYQKARKAFMRDSLSNPKVGKDIKGWIRQEINRVGMSGYWRSPPGYDVGHKKAGIDRPENFQWEYSSMNRSKGAKFKR